MMAGKNFSPAIVFCVLAVSLGAQQTGGLTWPHEGYPALLEAAGAARKADQRLLIGLSGGDT